MLRCRTRADGCLRFCSSVVATDVWPTGIVEAIFETHDYDTHARWVHEDYLESHGTLAASAFPLLKLNLWDGGDGGPLHAPFSAALQ